MIEVGDLDDKRHTDAPTARWRITPPKHAASGNALRAETAIMLEMRALGETMVEKVTTKCATTVGSQAISDPIVLITNERRTHEAEFTNTQLQLPPLEIEISSHNPMILSPAPPPPLELGSLIPGPLTICATIAALSSHSINYAALCSLNLARKTR
jgi:hypothetical protein